MFIPPGTKPASRCNRCGLRYSRNDSVCPHCDGLTDGQVRRIRRGRQGTRFAEANFGRLLLYIAGLVLVVMVMLSLNGS